MAKESAWDYVPPEERSRLMSALARKKWAQIPPEERSRLMSEAARIGAEGRKAKRKK